MGRAPNLSEYLTDVLFFVVTTCLFIGAAWKKSRNSAGAFRWVYYVPVAPLIALCWSFSWQWLFDVTAANLWPLALFLLAIPCGIVWVVISLIENRSKRQARPL